MAARIRRDSEDLPEHHEINVTPMIDVMLVLLIIFMVTAPLATADVPVNLAAASAAPSTRPVKAVVLTLKADLSLILGGREVSRTALAAALEAKSGSDRTDPVYLLADRTVPYGEVMTTMGALKEAGYKVSLVTTAGPAG